MAEKGDSIVERSLLDELLQLLEHGGHPVLALLLSRRDEDSVLFDVAVITVMSGMADLPREVRYHKQ